MTRRRTIWIAVSLAVPVLSVALWWTVFRHGSYIPKTDTIRIRNGIISVRCEQDEDCMLVDPTIDFTSCNAKVTAFCSSPLNDDRAVNRLAFEAMAEELDFKSYESCQPQQDPAIEPIGQCLGGWFPYDAPCLNHRCAAIRSR